MITIMTRMAQPKPVPNPPDKIADYRSMIGKYDWFWFRDSSRCWVLLRRSGLDIVLRPDASPCLVDHAEQPMVFYQTCPPWTDKFYASHLVRPARNVELRCEIIVDPPKD